MSTEAVWRVTDVYDGDRGDLVVGVTFKPIPTSCTNCGSGRKPRRYGNLKVSYRDAPFLGRQVSIVVDVQRFRCADCGRTFFQDLADMDVKRRMTTRCASYVVEQVMVRSSMRDVAHIIGVDEKSVRNVFDDRGLIFTLGDPPSDDRFVCECCLGIFPVKELKLAGQRHFGRWHGTELRKDANVCGSCFDFAKDAWRAAVVRRLDRQSGVAK